MRGCAPTPTTTKSHSSARPSPVRTRSTAPSPSNASTPVPEQHLARRGRRGCRGRPRRPRGPSTRSSGTAAGSTTRHLQAALARRGGDLGADPAGADHDEPAAARPAARAARRSRRRAQVEHAVELAAGDAQPPRLGAGGQQQPVVARAARRRRARARAAPCRGRSTVRAEAQLDVVLGVEALVVDVDRLALGLAAQVVLRQRRALVGALGLGADEHQAPVEALARAASRRPSRRRGSAPTITNVWSVVMGSSSWSGPGTPGGCGRRRGRAPCSAEVTVCAPSFCTPRSDMHMCSASSTTPTPLGASSRCSQPAICTSGAPGSAGRGRTARRRGRASTGR